MEFIKAFNEHTADMGDTIIPAVITVFEDRSWEFVTKTPPVPELIKKALKLEKGGASVKKQKIGKLSLEQLREIAELKMPDLNARNIEAAQEMVRGTARSMGVDVG
jgi:large subunit ribosomal protein L11